MSTANKHEKPKSRQTQSPLISLSTSEMREQPDDPRPKTESKHGSTPLTVEGKEGRGGSGPSQARPSTQGRAKVNKSPNRLLIDGTFLSVQPIDVKQWWNAVIRLQEICNAPGNTPVPCFDFASLSLWFSITEKTTDCLLRFLDILWSLCQLGKSYFVDTCQITYQRFFNNQWAAGPKLLWIQSLVLSTWLKCPDKKLMDFHSIVLRHETHFDDLQTFPAPPR